MSIDKNKVWVFFYVCQGLLGRTSGFRISETYQKVFLKKTINYFLHKSLENGSVGKVSAVRA